MYRVIDAGKLPSLGKSQFNRVNQPDDGTIEGNAREPAAQATALLAKLRRVILL